MKNILQFLSILLSSMFCASCANTQEHNVEKDATMVMAKDAFADSIFFQLISDIELSDNRLFFSDQKASQIISSDINLQNPELIKFDYGRGPLDLFQSTQIDISDKKLIINDAGNKKFIVRDLENDITTSVQNSTFRYGEFSVRNDIYYVPYINDTSGKIVERLNLEGQLKSQIFLFPNVSEIYSKGSYHTLIHKQFLITIPLENTTVVQVRGLSNNQLISETDLSEIEPLINSSVQEFKSKGYPANASLMLFPDATIFDGKIYLILAYYSNEGISKSNLVLAFSIKKDGILELESKINLRNEGWYEALEIISRDRLVTFDHVNGTVELYEF